MTDERESKENVGYVKCQIWVNDQMQFSFTKFLCDADDDLGRRIYFHYFTIIYRLEDSFQHFQILQFLKCKSIVLFKFSFLFVAIFCILFYSRSAFYLKQMVRVVVRRLVKLAMQVRKNFWLIFSNSGFHF